MPATSVDTYANTNPAFCALVLRAFVEGFVQCDDKGMPLPHMIFPLPIVLSADLAATFAGTNANTGLLTWIWRHPNLTIGLRERTSASARFSREAVLFCLTQRILGINDRGLVVLDDEGLKKKVRLPISDDRGRAFVNARQLGRWVADVRSTETVFTCMGLNR